MKISFDLDDTLFINSKQFPTENKIRFPFSIFFKESLRKGTIELFNKLKEHNHELFIYTTSFRSVSYIKSYFKYYKIILDGVINGDTHNKIVQKGHNEILPSKYPNKFQIKLHVDDDISVKQNGDIYGFKVVLIKPDDLDWISKVIIEVARVNAQIMTHNTA